MAEAKTIAYLTAFPADHALQSFIEIDTALYDLETVLSIACEMAEFITWESKVPTIERAREQAEKIKRLVAVGMSCGERLKEASIRCSHEIESHLEHRIAA